MHSRIKTTRDANVPYIAFILIVIGLFVFLARQGFWFKSGAQMFLDNAPIIAPVYPLFLRIHLWIFGDGALTAAAISQLVIGFGVCLWFAHALRKYFSLPSLMEFVLAFILLIPYLPVTRFGNAIANEGLAYPLFLVVVKCVLEGLLHRKTSSLIKAFLWSVVLILVRKQFLLFYPIFVLVLVYIYVVAASEYRKHTLLVLFVITVIGTQLIERGWQYQRDGRFQTIPFSGLVLIAAPLFVSKSGDYKFLRTEEQKIAFKKIHAQMVERGFLKGSRTGTDGLFLQPLDHFSAAFNAICWRTVLPVLQEQGIKDWYRINSMTLHMAWTLARHNAGECLGLYRKNFVAGAGGKIHAVFLFLFLAIAVVFHFKHRDGLSLTAALVSLLSLGNILLVAMAEPILPRYLAYTENLQICLYVIVAYESFSKNRPPLFKSAVLPEDSIQ